MSLSSTTTNLETTMESNNQTISMQLDHLKTNYEAIFMQLSQLDYNIDECMAAKFTAL